MPQDAQALSPPFLDPADILFPFVPHNDANDLVDILHRNACPFGKVPWEQKVWPGG